MPRRWNSEGAEKAAAGLDDDDDEGMLGEQLVSSPSDSERPGTCSNLYNHHQSNQPQVHERTGVLNVGGGVRGGAEEGVGVGGGGGGGGGGSGGSASPRPSVCCLDVGIGEERGGGSRRCARQEVAVGDRSGGTAAAPGGKSVRQLVRRRRQRALGAVVSPHLQLRRRIPGSAPIAVLGTRKGGVGGVYCSARSKGLWGGGRGSGCCWGGGSRTRRARLLRGFGLAFCARHLSRSRAAVDGVGVGAVGGGGGDGSPPTSPISPASAWMGACVARFGPPRTPCIPRMTMSSKSLDHSRGSDSETMDAPVAGEHSKKPLPAGAGASGAAVGAAVGGSGGGAGAPSSKSTLSYPKRVGAPTLDLTLISPSSLERSPSTPSSSSSFAGLGSSRLLLQRRDSDMSIIEMMPSDTQVAWCQQALQALDEIFNSLRPKRGFDRDFQLLQQETDSKEFLAEAGGCSIGLLPGNAKKNRYCDVIPFDNSRVKLSNSEVRMTGTSTDIEGTADYINANFVKVK
ncbi:hypothetical protein CBR_g49511 [Chara braunii]|uniref:Tyrosine-protein phosphatase domain-containing protein n=1 Tax=Chara braunii TaxID=69332 RepID=A0A388K558_CHABU|nr:hypothetical protein CBR_g49511 [Chara braunii]|eukprot:GBG65149.1 hypothetical protein CBR_g49511 [Chara braunii]